MFYISGYDFYSECSICTRKQHVFSVYQASTRASLSNLYVPMPTYRLFAALSPSLKILKRGGSKFTTDLVILCFLLLQFDCHYLHFRVFKWLLQTFSPNFIVVVIRREWIGCAYFILPSKRVIELNFKDQVHQSHMPNFRQNLSLWKAFFYVFTHKYLFSTFYILALF